MGKKFGKVLYSFIETYFLTNDNPYVTTGLIYVSKVRYIDNFASKTTKLCLNSYLTKIKHIKMSKST